MKHPINLMSGIAERLGVPVPADKVEGFDFVSDEIVSQHEKSMFDKLSQFAQILKTNGNNESAQLNGFSYFETDPRSFAEMMLDWQIIAAIGELDKFLQHINLAADHDAVTSYEQILHGLSSPSKKLSIYLSNIIPEQVASKGQFSCAAAEARRICENQAFLPPPENSVTEDLSPKTYMSGQYRDVPLPYTDHGKEQTTGSKFYIKLIEGLKKFAKNRNVIFDEDNIIKNLAKNLSVDPWVLQGFIAPPSHVTAENLAGEIANLIFFENQHEVHEFYDIANEFFQSRKAVAINAAVEFGIKRNVGEIVFLLRDNANLSRYRFAELTASVKKSVQISAYDVARIEKGIFSPSSELKIFAILKALGLFPHVAAKLSSTIWEEHDVNWQQKIQEATTEHDKFRAERELAHVKITDLARSFLTLLPINSRSNPWAIQTISKFENGEGIQEGYLPIIYDALAMAKKERMTAFETLPVEEVKISDIVRERRLKIKHSQESLANCIVNLSKDKPFFKEIKSVQTMIASMETGKKPPTDPEKIEVIIKALEYDANGSKYFRDLCNSRSKIYWQAVFDGTNVSGTRLKAKRKLNYPSLSFDKYVQQSWNEDAAKLWSSQEAYHSSLKVLESASAIPRDKEKLRFICKAVKFGTEEEIESFVKSVYQRNQKYWLDKFYLATNFGEAFLAIRMAKNLSPDDLVNLVKEIAPQVEFTKQAVRQWENHIAKPKADRFEALCKVLELDEPHKTMLQNLWGNNKIKPAKDKLPEQVSLSSNLSPEKIEVLSKRLTSYMQREKLLRPRQKLRLVDVNEHHASGKTEGHIKGPTGSGKTILFCSEIVGYNTPDDAIEPVWDVSAIVVVPRKLLSKQVFDELVDKLKVDEDKIGIYHSGIADGAKKEALQKPILIITYGSLRSLNRRKALDLAKYPLVILDEIHMAKGELTIPIIREMRTNSIVHGYTATDMFYIHNEYKNISDILFDGAKPIHRTNFREAVLYRETVPVKNFIFETDINFQMERTDSQDYTPAQLKKVVNYKGRNEAAINEFAKCADPDTGEYLKDMLSVWYCNGITHATKVAEDLNKVFGEGYAVMVNGKMPYGELKKILKKHEEGEIRALINADLLIQGWNSPRTQVSVMLRPIKSPVVAEQTGGRIARLDPDNPSKIGYVLSFIDADMYDSLTFAQVVDGANIIPPDFKMPKPQNTGKTYEKRVLLMQEIDVRVHYTMRQIISFQHRREYQEMSKALEPKGDSWLTKEEYDRLLNISSMNRNFVDLWTKLMDMGEADGIKIRCGFKQSGTRQPFCAHIDDQHLIREFLKIEAVPILGLKTPEWYAGSNFAELIGTSYVDKNFSALFQQVKQTGKIGEVSVKCGYLQGLRGKVFCIHESEVQNFRKALNIELPEKTPEWKGMTEFKALIGAGRNDEVFKQLWELVKSTGELEGVKIRSGFFNTSTVRIFCVHESETEKFKKPLGLEEKTKEWKSATEFARIVGVRTTNPAFSSIFAEVEKTGEVAGHKVMSGYKTSGTHRSFCIHETETQFFRDKISPRVRSSGTRIGAWTGNISAQDNEPEFVTAVDLWNKLRISDNEKSFAEIQRFFLYVAGKMPEDTACGGVVEIDGLKAKYDLNQLSEEVLYLNLADTLGIFVNSGLDSPKTSPRRA